MASTVCGFCERLSIERILRALRNNSTSKHWDLKYESYPHQPSLGALKQSAENGCGFCLFINNCLNRTPQASWTSDSLQLAASDNPSIYLGLESDCAWENREILDGIGIVKHLHIRSSREHWTTRCTLELFTPSTRIMSIDEGDETFRIGRPKLDPNIASSATFNIAKGWLNECRHNHSGCLRESLPTLPSRVIDVGTPGFPSEPRLLITDGLRGDYVALSHCWGGNIATSLMTNTLSTYQNSLPYAQLPQNFRDAITITRELGVRYLWIDSLCILQDSKEDWTAESARMGSVYRDATVTVSAMIPGNSNSGILNQYQLPQRLSHKLQIYEADDRSDEVTAELVDPTHEGRERMDDLWEHSPLTSRGWTLQEFVLSPRHIFYGRRQIFWKCPEGFKPADGEIHDSLPVQHEELSGILHRDKLSKIPSAIPNCKKVLLSHYRLVQEYCKRQLTKTSDKLPAFSGIATNLQPVLGGDYLAGIWTSDLTHGLLWRRGFSGRESDARGYSGRESNGPSVFRKDSSAPSWSWAAARGIITYDHLDLPPTPWQIRLLCHEIVPTDTANPFGQVESAHIVVEGFTIPITPTSSDVDMAQLVKAAEVELTQSANEDSITLYCPLVATKHPGNCPSSIPIIPTSSDVDMGQLVKSAELEWNQSVSEDSSSLCCSIQPFTTLRPANRPSSTVPPSDTKEKLSEGDEVWKIIDEHWHKSKPLPYEIEQRLGDQVLVDSRDFSEDGLHVLLLYANSYTSYWADGNTLGLMVRPVPSKSGDVYERVGYVQLYRVRMKWLATLKTRIVTLV